MKKTCGTCSFFKKTTLLAGGFCLRHPPQVVVIPLRTEHGATMALQSVYPTVAADEMACGEYRQSLHVTPSDTPSDTPSAAHS